MAERRLPRVAKGRRARFHPTEGVDELFALVVALTAEVSALAERLRSLETILEEGRVIPFQAIEKMEISEDELAGRAVAREALIERVFQPLEASVARKRQR